MDTELKTPPHNLMAEQSVLGAVLTAQGAWDRVSEQLTADDFYRSEHRLIWTAMADLARRSQALDVVTVSESLEANGKDEESGGLAYLAALAQDCPGDANVWAWSKIIREQSVRRQLIRVGSSFIERGYAKDGTETAQILDEAEREVLQIAQQQETGRKACIPTADLVAQTVSKVEQRSQGGGLGVMTGLARFDQMTTGLHGGDLVIVAGRPAMGKTSLAMNWAEHCLLHGVTPAVFSMEMPAEQLMQRMLSSIGRINQQRLRTGHLSQDEWQRLGRAAAMVRERHIPIDDTPALSPNQIRSKARRMKREHGIGLIVVDYLQLMQVPGSKENRTNEISEISRSLKALAKELDVPVVALSQLNRSVEQRENKRPRMADLRESGGIEQDADIIAFVYRDEVYNPDTPDRGIAEIIIAKQRNGETGKVHAAFLGQYTRFENLADEYQEAAA